MLVYMWNALQNGRMLINCDSVPLPNACPGYLCGCCCHVCQDTCSCCAWIYTLRLGANLGSWMGPMRAHSAMFGAKLGLIPFEGCLGVLGAAVTRPATVCGLIIRGGLDKLHHS